MSFRSLSFAQLFVVLFALVAEFEYRLSQMSHEQGESSNEEQDPVVRVPVPAPYPPPGQTRQPVSPDHPPPGWSPEQKRKRSRSPTGRLLERQPT